MTPPLTLRRALPADVPTILRFIRALAEYERLLHRVSADESRLRESLFGPQPAAEVVLAERAGEPVGFALWFHTYSTFLARRGLYLEDLFVLPAARGQGVGRALLAWLARLAVERDCGRFEWSVLDWNEPAIRFYEGLGAEWQRDWRLFRLYGPALEQLAASAEPLPAAALQAGSVR
ncbi:MAG TPA: GNAT family N-acetyltransferase [Nevskiaceae bacterium]|nr:GNAT family N-acetyltransferase [Nevskiaceae bacterium]